MYETAFSGRQMASTTGQRVSLRRDQIIWRQLDKPLFLGAFGRSDQSTLRQKTMIVLAQHWVVRHSLKAELFVMRK
jgi:hypothetical protein